MAKHYPAGKISDDDDGALAIATYIEGDRMIINFGKSVSWLGFDKAYLRKFIDGLEVQYKKL